MKCRFCEFVVPTREFHLLQHHCARQHSRAPAVRALIFSQEPYWCDISDPEVKINYDRGIYILQEEEEVL